MDSGRRRCGPRRRSLPETRAARAAGPRPSRAPGSHRSRGRRRRRQTPRPSPCCGHLREPQPLRLDHRGTELPRDLRRAVGRAVVDHDDLLWARRNLALQRRERTAPSVRSALSAGMTTLTDESKSALAPMAAERSTRENHALSASRRDRRVSRRSRQPGPRRIELPARRAGGRRADPRKAPRPRT